MNRTIVLYILRRLAAIAILLAVMSFALFSLLYISPGSPIDILLGANSPTPAIVNALKNQYHLNQPFLTQYWIWARQALQLNFGNSIQTTLPVTDEIKARLPTSLYLGLYAFVLTMIIGVGGGVVAALNRRRFADRAIVGASIVAFSTPVFVSGIFLIYLLAIVVPIFPVFGKGAGFFDGVWHLTLPALALALAGSALVLKHTRSALIGVLDEDYVTFARARGLSVSRVLFGYTLRNALIPIVTITSMMLAFLIVGAALVEVVFTVPGIGQLLVQSATSKDVPVVQGVALIIAVVIMLANLIGDVLYLVVDPRIRLGGRPG